MVATLLAVFAAAVSLAMSRLARNPVLVMPFCTIPPTVPPTSPATFPDMIAPPALETSPNAVCALFWDIFRSVMALVFA